MGDLAVGATLGSEAHHTQLAGGQRLDTGAPLASRAGAGGLELLARASGQRTGAASGGEVERFRERLDALRLAGQLGEQRGPQLDQRTRSLEQRGRVPEADH